jgi:hypothetical protein
MKRKEKETKGRKPALSPQPARSSDYAVWIFKNLIVGILVYFMLQHLISNHASYNWAYNILMKGNYATATKYKHLSLDQRWEQKLGYTFAYWKHLRDNTPEDAVILYPTSDIFSPAGKKSRFPGEPASKLHALRFLYPRKLVYHTEKETNRYGKQLTHVAIVNGWGYEYLEYAVDNKVDDAVLPVARQDIKQ